MLVRMTALYEDSFPLTVASATDASGATAEALRRSTKRFRMYNAGPDTVYWSTKTGVTTANGFPLAAGEKMEPLGKEAQTDLDLYFVCAATETATVRIVEEA